MYQKLVVRRNVESGKMSAYLMSLIPDVGCDDKHIPEYIRSRGKDKRSFSGIVVYATIDRGAIVRVQEYRTGVLWRGVYIPSGQGTYIDRCVKAREILKGVTLMSRRNILTRSGEDDWGDYYGGELDGSICIGDKDEGSDDDLIQPGEGSPDDDYDEPWPDDNENDDGDQTGVDEEFDIHL